MARPRFTSRPAAPSCDLERAAGSRYAVLEAADRLPTTPDGLRTEVMQILEDRLTPASDR